jgi:tRNA threonylcarbamoyladenosine biosynthesis protein TsaB
MRPLLAIETSGAGGGVAVVRDDGSVVERMLADDAAGTARPSGRGRMLVPAIAAALEEAGVDRDGIRSIAVSIGPGSYTGLRIGVTAAKTMAWALSCDLAAVSTLEAIAVDALERAPALARRIVPVIDARRGELYAAAFVRESGALRRVMDDVAIPPAALAALLSPGDHLVGSGVSAYEELRIPEGATAEAAVAAPRPSTIARLGERLLDAGLRVDVHAAAPAYLRREGNEFTSAGRRA